MAFRRATLSPSDGNVSLTRLFGFYPLPKVSLLTLNSVRYLFGYLIFAIFDET